VSYALRDALLLSTQALVGPALDLGFYLSMSGITAFQIPDLRDTFPRHADGYCGNRQPLIWPPPRIAGSRNDQPLTAHTARAGAETFGSTTQLCRANTGEFRPAVSPRGGTVSDADGGNENHQFWAAALRAGATPWRTLGGLRSGQSKTHANQFPSGMNASRTQARHRADRHLARYAQANCWMRRRPAGRVLYNHSMPTTLTRAWTICRMIVINMRQRPAVWADTPTRDHCWTLRPMSLSSPPDRLPPNSRMNH